MEGWHGAYGMPPYTNTHIYTQGRKTCIDTNTATYFSVCQVTPAYKNNAHTQTEIQFHPCVTVRVRDKHKHTNMHNAQNSKCSDTR